MKKYILIHYAEIGLKKANRPYFAQKLKNVLRHKLKKAFEIDHKIALSLERFLISLPENPDFSAYEEVIRKIFGVRNYQFVYVGSLNLELLAEQIFSNFKIFGTEREMKNFCVRVKRSQTLPFKSYEAERRLGALLIEKGLDLKVKLVKPDLEINVEFFNNHGFFSFAKKEGAGGLPTCSSGKLVCLMSSGIDSPVAAYKMMRRGAEVIFAHFHSYPYSDMTSQQQVRDLVEILANYQLGARLYLLPLGKIQKKIATNVDIPAKIRLILFRRLMMRIAEKIAVKEKANGLVTGDNLGQVASQTLENLSAIHQVTTMPLFQPLISLDKEDIVNEATKIGTYEISALPCLDTCVMFSPDNPELRASVEALLELEKLFPVDDYVQEVLAGGEIIEN